MHDNENKKSNKLHAHVAIILKSETKSSKTSDIALWGIDNNYHSDEIDDSEEKIKWCKTTKNL